MTYLVEPCSDTKSSPDTEVLIVKGALDASNVVTLKTVLLDALGDCDHLVFHVEGEEHLCFNSFQLLCSTCRTAYRMKKRFSIKSDNLKVFKWVMGCAGLLKRDSCSLINDKCCFKNVSGTS